MHDVDRKLKWNVLKQHRTLPHGLRRLYHFLMGLACFSLYAWVIDRATASWLLLTIGGPLFLFDVLRLKSPLLKQWALRHFSPIMRRNELLGLTGNSFFILGLFVVVFFFSKPVALLSILLLAVGDPVAAFVGTRYGRTKMAGGKTLEGNLAGFFASALAGWAFALFYLGLSSGTLKLAVIAGLASALAEGIPSPIDDNFTIPVLSGLLLSVIHSFWPLY